MYILPWKSSPVLASGADTSIETISDELPELILIIAWAIRYKNWGTENLTSPTVT